MILDTITATTVQVVAAAIYHKTLRDALFGKTIYEIKIPREEVGALPDKALYFNFVVFDNKDNASAMPAYWLDMAEGLAGTRDNALLPLVLFE